MYNRLAALGLLNALLWYQFAFACSTLLLLSLLLFLAHNKHALYVLSRTWRRDFTGIGLFIRVERDIRRRVKENRPLHRIFTDEVVARTPEKPAFVSVSEGAEDPSRSFTFAEFDRFANKIANFFDPSSSGLLEGDCVAVLMLNRPEYIGTWLGLSKLGIVSALINFHQRLEPLGHSVRVAKAKAIVLDPEYEQAVAEAMEAGHIPKDLPLFVFGESKLPATNLLEKLKSSSGLPPVYQAKTNFKSILFYIYTSGTTGLPKPAIISHARYYFMACGTHAAFRFNSDDRLYIHMPLYHSAAGILGSGQVLLRGCSAAIKRKFSASKFWGECIQYECTVSQYLGEIARYLLCQPVRPEEATHKVRCMFGNGMRPGIWADFVKRFHIGRIGEFYGSTEGNAAILNFDNTVGKVGFLPVFGAGLISKIYPISLVKVDPQTGALIRGRDGLCLRAGPGECGEMVGKIVKGNPIKDFQGYTDSKDTEKKIIRDVFSKGDTYFSSGDILALDELGYLTFMDRTGDTFRWKGENVSTAEVEVAVQKALGLGDATVYGVAIPGQDGKAGMAGLVEGKKGALDLVDLRDKLTAALPPYARPVFLRILHAVDTTGTYKLKKTDYQRDGIDFDKVKGDTIYYLNSKSGAYEEMTRAVYQDILAEKVRF